MPLTVFPGTSLGSTGSSPSDTAVAIAAATLVDTCSIVENLGVTNVVSDGMGGFVDDWQPVRDYPCLIVPRLPGTEIVEGAKVTAIGIYLIYLPIDAILTPSNRILSDGIYYEVQDRNSKLSTSVLLGVMARRIE